MGEGDHLLPINMGLSEKNEGTRPFWKPTHRLEHIRIDSGETEWEVVEWIHLAQDRDQWGALVNTAMNLQVP
jgi:hypothetical protein